MARGLKFRIKVVEGKLICVFVFAYAKSRFSHNEAQLLLLLFFCIKVLIHLKPPRRFCTLFFDVLPFTDDASVVNGKTSKKSMQKKTQRFLVCVDL